MDTLREVIARWELAGTPEEIAAALNAKTEVVPVTEPVTVATILRHFGEETARALLTKFLPLAASDPLMAAIYAQLNSTGIPFASPKTQEILDGLAARGVFTPQEVETLKGLGVQRKSKWETVAGDGAVVTPEQVAAALAASPPVPDDRQVILSCQRTATATRVTLLVQPTAQGQPVGSPQIVAWTTGQEIPQDHQAFFSALLSWVEGVAAGSQSPTG